MRAVTFVSLVLLLALMAGCAPAGSGQGTTATTVPATNAPAATSAPTTAATEAATEAPTAAASATTEATAAPVATETTAATAEVTAAATSAGGTAGGAVPDNALVSVAAAEAPKLDGAGDDAAWANAKAVDIKTAGGANASDTTVSIKSVHTGDSVFFLLTWQDPTQSFLRMPWEKQADGTWKKLTDPDDKGGDNNKTYEDKISLIWNINDSIQGFNQSGCFTLCHAGENSDVKPYGNKYTPGDGQIGDIWHWKSVRNLNQVDDQYVDNTKYSKDTPEAGRKSDEKTAGGYVDNQTEDKKAPAFMAPNGGAKDGSPGYILDSEKVKLDDALFKAGDQVPGIIKSEFEGDRADLSAGWKYANGAWTLEIGRKLTTGSKTDVQFDDLAKTYYFGVATFDNAQVRHAFQAGATPFVFQK